MKGLIIFCDWQRVKKKKLFFESQRVNIFFILLLLFERQRVNERVKCVLHMINKGRVEIFGIWSRQSARVNGCKGVNVS